MSQPQRAEQPIEVVKGVYAAFGRMDIDAVVGLTAPEVVLTQDRALPWGGRYVGRDGVVDFTTSLVSRIDSMVTPEAIFEAGDHVIQYGRTAGTVRASGASFDLPECHVWKVRQGRVVEVAFYIDTPAMLRRLTTA